MIERTPEQQDFIGWCITLCHENTRTNKQTLDKDLLQLRIQNSKLSSVEKEKLMAEAECLYEAGRKYRRK